LLGREKFADGPSLEGSIPNWQGGARAAQQQLRDPRHQQFDWPGSRRLAGELVVEACFQED